MRKADGTERDLTPGDKTKASEIRASQAILEFLDKHLKAGAGGN